jgi:hypothetical protein
MKVLNTKSNNLYSCISISNFGFGIKLCFFVTYVYGVTKRDYQSKTRIQIKFIQTFIYFIHIEIAKRLLQVVRRLTSIVEIRYQATTDEHKLRRLSVCCSE